MSAFTGTSKSQHLGQNRSNLVLIEHVVTDTMANTDTLDLTLPSGIDPDMYPISCIAYAALSTTRAINSNIGITNHNPSTGVTRLTATGAVVAGATIALLYSRLS